MKLLVFVCVCVLATADQHGQGAVPTRAQLAVGLGHLYRRFLHVAAPKQLALQDALDLKYAGGMMAGPPFTSSAKGTFDGVEMSTFSFISSLISPGQKHVTDNDPWLRQDTSDIIIVFHYGGAAKIHMLTDGGVHKEAILGNPLDHKNAKFVIVVPKTTYYTVESLSEDNATFHSYMCVPAWDQANAHHFTHEEMEAKFPDHAELFHELAKEGVHHDDHHDDRHDHDHHDDRGGHGRQCHRRHRRD